MYKTGTERSKNCKEEGRIHSVIALEPNRKTIQGVSQILFQVAGRQERRHITNGEIQLKVWEY